VNRWSGFTEARVLLLGTGAHASGSSLADLPAVAGTLADLKQVLVGRCGLPAAAVRVERDPATPVELGDAVAAEAGRAEGLLVVYYVGHGLVSSTGALHLATRVTRPTDLHLPHTALPYDTVREYLRQYRLGGPARSLVVILDCCFSGRALDRLGDPADDVGGLTDISGAYVLTSAGRNELALAPPGARHTAFTGALLRLLTDGDPDGPAELTLHHAFRYLARTLQAAGLPRPRCAADDRAGELVLAPNSAYRPPPVAAASRSPVPRPPRLAGDGADACPYPGLAAFETADAARFFGRERLTRVLAGRLAECYDQARPLVVMGASGSGKSSLLRAGLLPAIWRGELAVAGSAGWPCLLFTPTADSVGTLARQTAPLAGVPADTLAAEIRADPARLAAALRRGVGTAAGHGSAGGRRVVLIVDQFEEVFTQSASESERRSLIAALVGAADGAGGEPPAVVVLGVRADFYGRCADYPALTAAVEGRPLVVGPMTAAEVRAAIENPAATAGVALEPGLLELLLGDLGVASDGPSDGGAYEAGRLPLLSHALQATWRQREGHTLTVAGYRDTGRIQGALAATADEAMAMLDAPGRETARELLLRLVHIGDSAEDTRRRVDRARLIADLPDPDQASRVLDAFAAENARLITVDEGVVAITHEALLHAWPTLRAWIDADRAGLLIKQQLVDTAHGWERDGRDPASLYQGTRLALAREWAESRGHGAALSPTARAFLDASIRTDRRRRMWATALGVGAALLLALIVVTTSLRDQSHQRQVAAGRNLLFQAESSRASQAGASLLLGIAAARVNPGDESRASLVSTLTRNHYRGSLPGQTGGVSSIAFDPRRTNIIATTANLTGELWDISDPTRPRRLATLPGHAQGVFAVAFSADGRMLVTGSWDSTAILWDVADPTRPQRLATLSGHRAQVFAVAFSPDGRTLATAGWDNTSVLWDVSEPTRPRKLGTLRDSDPLNAVAFSRDGRIVATGGESRAVILWDVSDPRRPRRLAVLTGHLNAVWAAAFSPDRAVLASASADTTAILWDISQPARPRQLGTLAGHTSSVRRIAFGPDGRTVATGSWDRTAILWNISDPVHPVRLDSLTGHTRAVESVAFSSDGQTVATGGGDQTVVLWDVLDRAIPRRLAALPGRAGQGKAVAFSPDGRLAATTDGNGGGHTTLWDVGEPGRPRRLAALTGHTDGVGPVAFSRDGTTVLTGGSDRIAILWDITEPTRPRQLSVLAGHQDAVFSVALSPTGRTAITGSPDLTAIVWDLTDPSHPRQVATLTDHANWVNGAAFSPDGHTAATAGGDGRALLWDLADPARPQRLGALAHPRGALYKVAFSPDGHTAATAGDDSTAILWDITDRAHPRRLTTLTGHASSVFAATFSPKTHILATSSWDRTVILWDITDPSRPHQLTTLTGHIKPVATLAFSPNGRILASASDDGSTVLWDVTELSDVVADPLDRACAITGRGLTRTEWTTYATGLPYQSTCPALD
jgi:WD40 repeat protein